jgi:aspartyl-tRNA(Asn)/glutamyl-tRNA(Gln) amidotransferase subunit B
MEVVSEPDLRSPKEAEEYLRKLRSILQYLDVSTGNMEEGSFRCDANISIRAEDSSRLGPKVEVKNMNSFRAVYQAMDYEAKRQRKALSEGKKLTQETRGWVEEKGKTVAQRSKEYAHDYRYFPEPDLPPLMLSREWVEEIKEKLPELPEDRRGRFMREYELSLYDASQLTSTKAMADYEEGFIKAKGLKDVPVPERAKLGSNWLLGEVSRIMNANYLTFDEYREKVNPEKLAQLVVFSHVENRINIATAKTVHEEMFNTGKSAEEIIKERGLSQISETGELEAAIADVINSNEQAVSDYKAGKEAALKFLVGQVMRATKGRANPVMAGDMLQKKLEEG